MTVARIEIESIDELESHLGAGGSLTGCVLQGLDLRGHTAAICGQSLGGTCLLGCELEPRALDHARCCGALVFPTIPGLPYRTYRGALYDVEELYAGYEPGVPGVYDRTLDGRVYAHFQARRKQADILETLAQRLHDHGITDALEELLHGDPVRKVVGVMGGHALLRNAPQYRSVAIMARALTREGFFVATGGGPGAMEAANLGAYMATSEDEALDAAIGILSVAPGFKDGAGKDCRDAWLDQAFCVRKRFPVPKAEQAGAESLSIPTWHYGHEPPNAFATHVAKYFENSVREEGLLAFATYGVIFTEGKAGTVQEIFQDACQNHYGSFDGPSPMVFFGETYWSELNPVFPLLAHLAAGCDYARWLAITDSVEEVVEHLKRYRAAVEAAPQGARGTKG